MPKPLMYPSFVPAVRANLLAPIMDVLTGQGLGSYVPAPFSSSPRSFARATRAKG
jgi:hypothetical protein